MGYTLANIVGNEAYKWGIEFSPINIRGNCHTTGWFVCMETGTFKDRRGHDRTRIEAIVPIHDNELVSRLLNIHFGTAVGLRLIFEYEKLLPTDIRNDSRYLSLKSLMNSIDFSLSCTKDRGTEVFILKLGNIIISELLKCTVTNRTLTEVK